MENEFVITDGQQKTFECALDTVPGKDDADSVSETINVVYTVDVQHGGAAQFCEGTICGGTICGSAICGGTMDGVSTTLRSQAGSYDGLLLLVDSPSGALSGGPAAFHKMVCGANVSEALSGYYVPTFINIT